MRALRAMAVVSCLWAGACLPLPAQTRAVIPTADQVGAACMPDTLAPIRAPFEMPQLTRPVFPDHTRTLTAQELQQHRLASVAIQQAIDERREGKRRRGASTISQQTAKNVFLWERSSWVRKGFEAYFTVLIELFWSKERIMEVYLNSIEMGDGIYGAEAVAKHHFNTTPDRLSRSQCALIAASLPNPLRFDSGHPSSYLYRRQRKIMRLMKLVPVFPEPEKKHN